MQAWTIFETAAMWKIEESLKKNFHSEMCACCYRYLRIGSTIKKKKKNVRLPKSVRIHHCIECRTNILLIPSFIRSSSAVLIHKFLQISNVRMNWKCYMIGWPVYLTTSIFSLTITSFIRSRLNIHAYIPSAWFLSVEWCGKCLQLTHICRWTNKYPCVSWRLFVTVR